MTLKNLTVDITGITTDNSNHAAAITSTSGTISMDSTVTIKALPGDYAVAATWLVANNTGTDGQYYDKPAVITINGSDITGQVIASVYSHTYDNNGGTPALNGTSKVIINSGTINGSISTGVLKKAGHAIDEADAIKDRVAVEINGGTFSDGDILQYIKSGSTVTITGTTTLAEDAAEKFTVAKGTTINYDVGARLNIELPVESGASAEDIVYTLTNNGTINFAKGASVVGWDTTKPTAEPWSAYVNNDNGSIKFDGTDAKPEEVTATTGKAVDTAIEAALEDAGAKNAIIVLPNVAADADETVDVGAKEVAFVGKDGNNTVADLNVSVTTGSVSFSGFSKVSGKITTGTGTDAKTVTLKDMQGSFTITKGSVIIDGKEYAGEITVTSGTELKMAGSVSGDNFTVKYSGTTGTAKVIIESGDDKTLEIKGTNNLIIDSDKIALQVDGKLFGTGTGGIVTAGNITVNGELSVATVTEKLKTAPAAYYPITITANSGSTVKAVEVTFNNTKSQFVAYSGSDINGIAGIIDGEDEAAYDQLVGKDALGGEWAVTKDGTKLTLNGYNGTYNLGVLPGITTITVVGVNSITYAAPETGAELMLFPAVTEISTTKDAGSLSIEYDASKLTKDVMETVGVTAVGGLLVGTLKVIDSVDLEVTIKGTNATWDAKEIKAIGIFADTVKGLDIDNSDVEVSVLTTYTADAEYVYGIYQDTSGITANASSITINSAGTGFAGTGFELKNRAVMSVSGKAIGVEAESISVRGASAATITGGAEILGIDDGVGIEVMQDSTLSVDGLVFGDPTGTVDVPVLTNNGTINLSGKTVILAEAVVNNEAVMNIEGTVNVFGTLKNSDGTMTNNGTITSFAKIIKPVVDANDITITFPTNTTISAGTAQVQIIDVIAGEFQNDGSLKITDAAITGMKSDKSTTVVETGYTGTLTTSQNVTADKVAYKLTLTKMSGTSIVSSVTLNYDATGTTAKYSMAVSGKITGDLTLVKPTADAALSEDKILKGMGGTGIIADGAALITAAGGTFDNDGTITAYGTGAWELVANGATFEGDITTGVQTSTINGTYNGNITAKGAVNVVYTKDEANGKVEGNITTSTGVTSSGTIKGDITSEGSVVVKNVEGNITINREAVGDIAVTVSGKVVGDLTYNSKYKATKEAETKTTYTATLSLDADLSSSTGAGKVTIKMMEGANATETEAVKPGYFAFNKDEMGALATGKNVNIKVTAGTFAFPESINMPVRYAMVFEAGSTAEVATTATVDVSNAALKVSKDAKSNFVTGTTPVTDYGVVKCIMSFTIQDGAYTIYSDVAYAVANCEEGSTLTVEAAEAPINDNITVPKNVNVIVSTGSTMSFGAHGLSMSEGAKITIVGTAKVTFGQTGKAPTTEAIYNVNGTFAFGDNIIVLDKVRFNAYANTIAGIAATASDPAKISLDVSYNDGTLTMSEGTGAGKITLTNTPEKQQKSDTKEKTVFGTFAVAEGAIFDATAAIVDAQYEVKYKKVTDGFVVDEVVKMPSIVVVNGTLNLSKGTTATGVYLGAGKIVLADGQSFILASGATKDVGTEKKYAASVTAQIVDSTDDENGYALLLVSNVNDDDAADLIIKADKYKDAKVMTIKGTVDIGAIKAIDDAYLNGVIVNKDAGIIGDDVYIIGATTAHGEIGAITMHMRETGSSDYEKLTYEATFEEDGYTVYTDFKNIDFDDVTDITIDGKDVTVDKKLDLSGKDVNITIADDYKLVLEANLIIGTPITVLGSEGSSIVGKVVINNDLTPGAEKFYYLVAYSDVDLTLAEITVSHNGVAAGDAVSSKLIVEENLYATIFAEEDTIKLSKADAAIVPEIVGYNFTAWINYNGDANATVGETNAYAEAKATYVTVIVKYVAGVDYYMNGVLFNVYDIPTDVPYGSYFTAKISDTTKYQGNPVINGEKTVCVIDDMELVASGVTPIPEPTPEPAVGDSGLSLTDILLIVLVILIAIMVVILVLRLNRS
ncbi:MAG: hypothetical protein E7Z65_01720 [Thermoplasmata archaeon]|nr:hypothetical protein [Thermoplasmata archaeon]